ncbi:Apoptosis regulator R1 [Merluccius polli]|uniref:Apoptosis regulator R1 n=1 Tax=Merluccius polli TaxID=89951 RepID=A0AA47NTC0_MERPO|nr:Apoptosis regulator R1 [Merluccius polli]
MCQAEVSLGLNSPDPLVREAHVMAHDYIAYVIGGRATHPRSRGAAALRHAGDELLLRFPIFFRRWPRVFRDVSETTAWPTLMALLDQHFFPPPAAGRRPELAWSAVLSVYVLAGQMALHCRERGMLGVLPQLQEAVGAYVERVVCPEIRDRGGWSGFVTRFGPKADLENQVRSACCWALLLLAASILSYSLWKRMA